MSAILNPQPQMDVEEQQLSQQQAQKPHQFQQVNPIVLLKQPDLFKETFIKITKNALQLFKNKDIEKAVLFLNNALDMLDLGKNILKDCVSKYMKITIFANLAYGYQILRKLQKCNRYCQRAKQQLQKLIFSAKNQQNSIDKYLKLSKFLVTLKFQHCAIVSQLDQHQKALQMCKSTLPQLKQQIQSMLKYLRQNSASKLYQKKTGQTVQFSRQVQKFAQNLLLELINYLNEPLRKFHFYYWQKNPQQNEQQVKKKFIPSNIQAKNESKRSILGVSKSNSWMDEFNIGSIMHMSLVTVDDFQTGLPMEEYFFKDKLYEIVILCSLSYFTMATEIRFIEPDKQKTESEKQLGSKNQKSVNQLNEQKSELPQSSNIEGQSKQEGQQNDESQIKENKRKSQSAAQILKKYGYQERSQLHKLSQLYHLRSIQIYCKNIQSVIPYLLHIIKSYDKHYLKKKELQPIAAINQQSQMSLMNESVRQYLPQQKIYDDYLKKEKQKNKSQQLMDQLLLQSQDNHRSIILSRNKSEQKTSQVKNQDLTEVKNILDFNGNENEIQYNNANILRAKKNLSKIIEDPKLQSQIHLYSKVPQQPQTIQNEVISGQYLKSKKDVNLVKSPKKTKNVDSKRSKSKSKLNLIKSRQKQSTFKKTDRSLKKTIQMYKSPNQQKRPTSKSHYDVHHSGLNANQGIIKKFHSPDLLTINESKKRLKTHLSDKSREKLLKKFVGVPVSNYESKTTKPGKNGEKKGPNKEKEGQKKKESKYYTTFDGQKEYRIKHQSTTHIKVLYKKKNLHEDNQGH